MDNNNDDDDDDNDGYDSGHDAQTIKSSHRDSRREAKLVTSGISQDIKTNNSRLWKKQPQQTRTWQSMRTATTNVGRV